MNKTTKSPTIFKLNPHPSSFCSRVFDLQLLPKKIAEHLEDVKSGLTRFNMSFADEIAQHLYEWASHLGATHYMHWFQPLRAVHAEKHDSFVIEKFSGKQLMYGEPDGSSFPSGGLRVTHQARGYTAWDCTTIPFLWESAEGFTLCIPALFYSWNGEALDHQIPLIKSDQKIGASAKRLLDLCKIKADVVFSTLGAEQEYFLLDRGLFQERTDLALCGRTVFGAKPARGQELEDHYFGPIKERVMDFMGEFEEQALKLGIPIKTRHNEVAPSQHETAPLFERATTGSFHNLLLMEVMRRAASSRDLSCLFHEKPFAKVNGSGKHNNWSLATDTGINLLNPKENSLLFLTTLTAVLKAVHDHSGLLRATIGSAGNDHRLGGSEAPPSILSVFLGESLEKLVQEIVQEKPQVPVTAKRIDLGLSHLPYHEADMEDRNRTSFFAFTGNKFEFRAVGSSQNCAFPISVLNSIVADSLQLILDEIADAVQGKEETDCFELALPVLRKHLKAALPVVFGGNNYSSEWQELAAERGLPIIPKSFNAFAELLHKKSIRALEGVLSESEIQSRFEILVEQYAKTMAIEANLMLDLFQTQLTPAIERDLERKFSVLKSAEQHGLKFSQKGIASILTHLEEAQFFADEIRKLITQSAEMGWEAKGKVFCELIAPKMDEMRMRVDGLEMLVDDSLWPLPKYRELLYTV